MRSSSCDVIISIDDVNDHPPRFKKNKYTFSVFEDQLPGAILGNVHAFDLDLAPFNNQFYFSLVSQKEY